MTPTRDVDIGDIWLILRKDREFTNMNLLFWWKMISEELIFFYLSLSPIL